MTPVYLNPLPSSTTKDHDHDHHFHLFMINSPPTTSISSPISSTSTNHPHDPRQAHFSDVDDHYNKGGSSCSTHPQLLQDESLCEQVPDQQFLAQSNPSINVEPARWMSCKVRSVHKTINSSSDGEAAGDDDHKPSSMKMRQSPQDDLQHGTSQDHTNHFTKKTNNSTIIRVCSDCSTTTTPLWRSGPRGPKSLCNACGIRQRKARRAMAEAAAVSGSEPAPAPAMKANNKEKKARTGLVATMKKQCKQVPDHSSSSPNKKLFFKDLALRLSNNSTFQRVFPRDEEEAAFLLMELSCGLAHT